MSSEKHSGINVIHRKGDILEKTIGRIGSIPTNIALATPSAILKTPSEETAKAISQNYKDAPFNGNVEVYVGHSPLLKQMKRLFQHGRRTNIFARVGFGIPTTFSGWLGGKLARSNLYNPYAETVQVYHPNPAVGMYEIGKALNYDQSKHPTLRAIFSEMPIVKQVIDWRSSENAMKYMHPADRDGARKIIEPIAGSSIGDLAVLGFVGLLAGHAHARLSHKNPFIENSKPRAANAEPEH